MTIDHLQYIRHHYAEDLDYFYKNCAGHEGVCGWTAGSLIRNLEEFVSTSSFIALIAEFNRLSKFLDNYFWEYSVKLPIFPFTGCVQGHGGIHDVDSMLMFFYNSQIDKRQLPTNQMLLNYRELLIHEYAPTLTVNHDEKVAEYRIGSPIILPKDEVVGVMIAGRLNKTSAPDFSTFLQFQNRYETEETISGGKNLRYLKELQEMEDAFRAEVKQRRAERATPKLFNAVRRGDIKAVTALLNQGAEIIHSTTLDGEPLMIYAKRMANPKILDVLETELLKLK